MRSVELNLYIIPTSPDHPSPTVAEFRPLAYKGIQHIFSPGKNGEYEESALNAMRMVGAAMKNIDTFIPRNPTNEGLGQFRRRIGKGIQTVIDPVVTDVLDSQTRAKKSGEKPGDGIRGVGFVLPIPMAHDFLDVVLNGTNRRGNTHAISLDAGTVYSIRMQENKASYTGSFPLAQKNNSTGSMK